jgi:hypothetical protein
MNFDHCRPFGANSRKIVEDHMDVIHFTQNITDPLNDADAKGAPFPPAHARISLPDGIVDRQSGVT